MNDDEQVMRYSSRFIQKTFSSDQRVPTHDSRGASRYTVEFPETIKNVTIRISPIHSDNILKNVPIIEVNIQAPPIDKG